MAKRIGLQHISELIDRNIILRGADALSSRGFTQVPNHVLRSSAKISPGAKLCYAMLLSYAWQNDFCFPGQERLAKDMGSGVRSVVRYIKELETQGFLKVRRRGQGKANIYELSLTAHRRTRGGTARAKLADQEMPIRPSWERQNGMLSNTHLPRPINQ